MRPLRTITDFDPAAFRTLNMLLKQATPMKPTSVGDARYALDGKLFCVNDAGIKVFDYSAYAEFIRREGLDPLY